MLRQLWLLFRRKLLETIRQPIWVILGLTTPLLYLALFAPVLEPLGGGPGFSSGDVLDVFVPGILALMAFGAGTGAGWIVISELEAGVIERLRVTPVSRFALVLGPALRDTLTMLIPALIVVVVAVPFGFHADWTGIALLMLLLGMVTIVTSAASSALGLILLEVGSLAAIWNGVNLPILLLSGVLLPLSLAPGWMQLLAHLNPLYYVVEAARDLAAGTMGSWVVLQGFLIMTLLSVVVLWWTTRTYRQAV
ncbi:MAG TPA: ABC transporter permease, partial [Thermomicrobiales bacterium]|nr:ABC transporter permease [Thermomicrobiales bacterium]